jgi:hypothetical protein
MENLTMWNSTVTATAWLYGAGIGSGYGDGGASEVDEITISNCTVTTESSSHGSGIGSSDISLNGIGRSAVGLLRISNSTIMASGAMNFSAIGSGPSGSEVGSLVFSGLCLIECNRTGLAQTINASSIVFSDASLIFFANGTALFGTSPSNTGCLDLIIAYHQVTSPESECISSLRGPFLHVGNVSVLVSRFCIRRSGLERCLDNTSGPIRSVVVGIGDAGPYSFRGWVDNDSHILMGSDGEESFSVDFNDSFVAIVLLGRLVPTHEFRRTEMFDATRSPRMAWRWDFPGASRHRNRVRLVD